MRIRPGASTIHEYAYRYLAYRFLPQCRERLDQPYKTKQNASCRAAKNPHVIWTVVIAGTVRWGFSSPEHDIST